VEAGTEIRLWGYLSRIAPQTVMKRQARAIERAFDADLAKEKDWQERSNLMNQREYEASEYWNALADFRSHRLVLRAQKYYLDTGELKWRTDQYANRFLDDAAQAKLNRVIIEERRKKWEFRIKAVGGVLGTLTGLVGAVIGLVAVWKKK
jgi:hypothetical protein